MIIRCCSDIEDRHLPPPSSRVSSSSLSLSLLSFFLLSFPLLPYFSPVRVTQQIDKPSVNIITTLYQFCQCEGGPIVTAEMGARCISLVLKRRSDWQSATLIYLLPRGDTISVYHADLMSCQGEVRETTGAGCESVCAVGVYISLGL